MNSCGPGSLTFEFLPKFKACNGHDKRYEYALKRTYATRKKIDKIFYWQMRIESPDKKKIALTYYIIVRLFGWTRFYF